jgi:quinol monooxygenase YgiN
VERLRVIATCPNIPGENLAQFKKAAAQALEVARGETTTTRYDWFFNDDETACVALEEYENSDALLAHVGSLGPLFATLLDLGGDCRFEVFGDATPAVREATAALDITFFGSRFQGK